MKKILTIIAIIVLVTFGLVTLKATEAQDSARIQIPDGILFGTGEESFVTDNDTVTCLYTVENGLILFQENDYIVRGKKISKNHPNYGYLQLISERYFTHEDPQYLSFPNGKITPDKFVDIKKYGAPSQNSVQKLDNGKFHITLTWKNVDGQTVQHTYDEYGKRLF